MENINLEELSLGTKIIAKELIGSKDFNIMFSKTLGYKHIRDLKIVKNNHGEEIIQYVYGDGQYNTISSEQKLYVVGHKTLSHKDNVFMFLGRNWRNEY